MNGIIKEKVTQSGYTHKHLAKKIGVSQTFFSQVFNGHKSLSTEKEQRLRDILNSVVLV